MALSLVLACTGAVAQQTADVDALEAAAQRGDARALVALAVKYERGENVARDFKRSNELYCKAAARGDAEAMMKLGVIYSIGRDVPADEGAAALLITKAAELGNERARELLQHISRRNDGTLPACVNEPIAVPAEPPPPPVIPAARKELVQLVQHWAPQYTVDPDLVMALISVESNFNVKAVSPRNAQGLMQLIPATAERFGVKNAYHPLDNLKGGLAYLRWLFAYFQGDVALVLAAYNAGEEAVERHRGIPPYRETQNYVRQITSVYRKITHPYLSEVVMPSPVLNRIRRGTGGN